MTARPGYLPCATTLTGTAFDFASNWATKAPPSVIPTPYELGFALPVLRSILKQETTMNVFEAAFCLLTEHVIDVPRTMIPSPAETMWRLGSVCLTTAGRR